VYNGFLTNGKIPGPTLIMDEGDIVSMTIVNKGTVPHGASIHAAYTQTSKYVGNIAPGESKTVVFRATVPGVYMYHCAPGGHAIPMHVLFGQYGMLVVEPNKKYKLEEELGHEPDINLYLIQHEFYDNGKDALEGKPIYTAFNGKLFRYVEEPIVAKPGDYVRIHFLNIGPNLISTFHLVGIIWDYVYWQGNPDAVMQGGQTVTAGPSDSFVIEFRVPPDEGAYLMLSHAVGSTARGAIGVLVADGSSDAESPKTFLSDGPKFTEAEIAEMTEKAIRTISPFAIGNSPADRPVVYGPETEEVFVQIIGNSYYPKVIEIEPGTKVTWMNEEVFTYMAGEFSGIHNAVATSGPERFATKLLAHAETDSFTFTQPGEYDYMCTPHPYMKGRIIVREAATPDVKPSGGCSTTSGSPAAPLVLMFLVMGAVVIQCKRKRRI
ncbi:MAG: plastocyanin/azurin family copper-binding protein, partial [Bradymonadaceae bacterium]